MSRKITHDKYVVELLIKNPNIVAIDTYVGMKTQIMHRCLVHDVTWETTPERVLYGGGCPECKRDKIKNACVKSHQQYIQEVKEVNQDIDVIETYVNSKTPIEHYCKKHNVFWNAMPYNILYGCGCPECGKEKSTNSRTKTHKEYVMEIDIINPDIEVIGEYVNAHTPILHRCKIDNCEWMALPANIVKGSGCPECNASHGEKQICKWLNDNKVQYLSQHTFDDCRNKKLLPFDFYLPDYNICIEYDGEQHFRPIDYFGGENGFKQRQRNDQIKTQYCKNNNINLLRIPYFKNIEEELEKFLFI